ncbi:hypothetical protein D9758_013244 [Tetrapyrgos nigripes]|uniref:Uncharacterized protein n=1 Tax=Tetrapyrgos nigripes TaxID=182062 RepID=A0A8H5CPI3_9AGAR|nr:hypothetical protein D9758_013244 [Tetrapyrgos nigripes]
MNSMSNNHPPVSAPNVWPRAPWMWDYILWLILHEQGPKAEYTSLRIYLSLLIYQQFLHDENRLLHYQSEHGPDLFAKALEIFSSRGGFCSTELANWQHVPLPLTWKFEGPCPEEIFYSIYNPFRTRFVPDGLHQSRMPEKMLFGLSEKRIDPKVYMGDLATLANYDGAIPDTLEYPRAFPSLAQPHTWPTVPLFEDTSSLFSFLGDVIVSYQNASSDPIPLPQQPQPSPASTSSDTMPTSPHETASGSFLHDSSLADAIGDAFSDAFEPLINPTTVALSVGSATAPPEATILPENVPQIFQPRHPPIRYSSMSPMPTPGPSTPRQGHQHLIHRNVPSENLLQVPETDKRGRMSPSPSPSPASGRSLTPGSRSLAPGTPDPTPSPARHLYHPYRRPQTHTQARDHAFPKTMQQNVGPIPANNLLSAPRHQDTGVALASSTSSPTPGPCRTPEPRTRGPDALVTPEPEPASARSRHYEPYAHGRPNTHVLTIHAKADADDSTTPIANQQQNQQNQQYHLRVNQSIPSSVLLQVPQPRRPVFNGLPTPLTSASVSTSTTPADGYRPGSALSPGFIPDMPPSRAQSRVSRSGSAMENPYPQSQPSPQSASAPTTPLDGVRPGSALSPGFTPGTPAPRPQSSVSRSTSAMGNPYPQLRLNPQLERSPRFVPDSPVSQGQGQDQIPIRIGRSSRAMVNLYPQPQSHLQRGPGLTPAASVPHAPFQAGAAAGGAGTGYASSLAANPYRHLVQANLKHNAQNVSLHPHARVHGNVNGNAPLLSLQVPGQWNRQGQLITPITPGTPIDNYSIHSKLTQQQQNVAAHASACAHAHGSGNASLSPQVPMSPQHQSYPNWNRQGQLITPVTPTSMSMVGQGSGMESVGGGGYGYECGNMSGSGDGYGHGAMTILGPDVGTGHDAGTGTSGVASSANPYPVLHHQSPQLQLQPQLHRALQFPFSSQTNGEFYNHGPRDFENTLGHPTSPSGSSSGLGPGCSGGRSRSRSRGHSRNPSTLSTTNVNANAERNTTPAHSPQPSQSVQLSQPAHSAQPSQLVQRAATPPPPPQPQPQPSSLQPPPRRLLRRKPTVPPLSNALSDALQLQAQSQSQYPSPLYSPNADVSSDSMSLRVMPLTSSSALASTSTSVPATSSRAPVLPGMGMGRGMRGSVAVPVLVSGAASVRAGANEIGLPIMQQQQRRQANGQVELVRGYGFGNGNVAERGTKRRRDDDDELELETQPQTQASESGQTQTHMKGKRTGTGRSRGRPPKSRVNANANANANVGNYGGPMQWMNETAEGWAASYGDGGGAGGTGDGDGDEGRTRKKAKVDGGDNNGKGKGRESG